jgi:hypothetical protein
VEPHSSLAASAPASTFAGTSHLHTSSSARSIRGQSLDPQDIAAASSEDGFVVDLAYEAIWGYVAPGDEVTVTRTSDDAYGAAEADGVGFFWTPLWRANGQPESVGGGDIFEVYVNGTLTTTLSPVTITGQVDVLNDRVVGAFSGAGSGTPVTVTVGLEGAAPVSGAPQESTTTDASGAFTVTFNAVDLGAETLVAVDYPVGSNHVRDYLYPNARVFSARQYNQIAGYATPNQAITATVYVTYPTDVRWENTATAGSLHGWYNVNQPADDDIEPGDVVEVNLGESTVFSTTVFDVGNLSFDTDLDQIYGAAPSGETVRVSMWQWRGDERVYTQTTDVASADAFTATFTGADLRPRDWVAVVVADANGSQTQLRSGAPFLDVWLDPTIDSDGVVWRVDGPKLPVTLSIQTASGVYTRENPIGPSDAGNAGMAGHGVYAMWGPDWGPINFTPGDTVTLKSPSTVLTAVIADLSWEADRGNDRITGETPAGSLEVTAKQWQGDGYPIHGSATQTTTASSPYTATFAGFDVRDGGTVEIRHFDPASDFATFIHDWDGSLLPYFEVHPPKGISARPVSSGDTLTATLYESDGSTQKRQTSQDTPDSWGNYWLDMQGDIRTGDWVSVTDGAGWTAGMQVPTLTIQADPDTEMIWGEGPESLLFVEHSWDDGWDGRFLPGSSYTLDRSYFGGDVRRGDWIAVYYQAPSGNRVRRRVLWPLIVARYHMNDYIWGHNAIPGSTIPLTVTRGVGNVIATDTTVVGECEWCNPDSFRFDIPDGTLMPDDVVTVDFGDGVVESLILLDVTAEANPNTEILTVTAPVGFPVSAYGWTPFDDDWNSSWSYDDAEIGPGGYITFDLSVDGFNIVPGMNFAGSVVFCG